LKYPDFRLETYFAQWEFVARHHLTASDAQSMTVSELLALGDDHDRACFEHLSLGYTETRGAPDLRAQIAATFESRSADDVICFGGAEEGIFIAMHALLEAGDHAIVVTPNYQSTETLPMALCRVTGVPLDPDANWTLDVDRVAAAIRPDTKLVSINFPHNPTGKILEFDRFTALVDLCRKHGLYLFSDEVYRLLGREGTAHLPQAADVYERALSLGVMSKAYGMPGLRIGWIACQDADLLSRMERLKHYVTICSSAPSERLALIALKARDRILARNCGIVSANLKLLDSFFEARADLFEWYRPDGGCVAYPRYKGPEGVEAFAARALATESVLLLPASIYRSELGAVPADRFRIGFGRKNMEAALEALARVPVAAD
jgi:aspartate/methionine/tyrosine aminotransferase